VLWWLWSVEAEDNSICYPLLTAVFDCDNNCIGDALALEIVNDFFLITAGYIATPDYTFPTFQ